MSNTIWHDEESYVDRITKKVYISLKETLNTLASLKGKQPFYLLSPYRALTEDISTPLHQLLEKSYSA